MHSISLRKLLLYSLGYLVVLGLLTACDYRTDRKAEEPSAEITEEAEESTENTASYSYAVYLENSGSMDGYVRGVTDFEDDIYKLLVDISYLADSIQVHYINSRIIPYREEIQSFVNNLEPDTFQQRGGNRSSSNLNQVLNLVLQEIDKTQLNVLISDFIFSIGSGNTEEKLNNQRISIYNTFRSRLQQQRFSTLIIKMHSEFNGSYYNKNDQPLTLNGVERPYYIWLMGPKEAVENFREKINLQRLQGFEHTYLLTAEDKAEQPYFTVLNNYEKTGSFRADRNFSGNGYVRGISGVEAGRRGDAEGAFGFSLAVDMKQIPVDEDYLTNPENYEVTEAYELEEVVALEAVDNLNPRDKALVENKATHILIFRATGNAYPDLQVGLRKQTPAWVAATQTKDDTGIKGDSTQWNKTFGFGYLVQGVEEAYQTVNRQDVYFSLEVSVNK